MPKLYIINDSVPNAFATGRDKKHAVVAVTTGLMNILDKSEMEGVIAHELSHIGNRDMLVSTVVVVLVGFITLLSDMFLRSQLFGGGGDRDRGDGRVQGILMIVGIVLMILSPIIATLIQLSISRKREYLADASGALLTRYPEGLASALEKIHANSGKMRRANHATAHLFISNPFGDKIRGLFATHPPVEKRIELLRKSL
jgi:heat shock protein HtpX